MNYFVYNIVPVPKPRMTQSDKWKKRDCVLRYRDFCDKCRSCKIQLKNNSQSILFVLPMPKSWSKKKREKMKGKPHTSRPDLDNLEKALSDAILKEDSMRWDGRATKIWGNTGTIILYDIDKFVVPDEVLKIL